LRVALQLFLQLLVLYYLIGALPDLFYIGSRREFRQNDVLTNAATNPVRTPTPLQRNRLDGPSERRVMRCWTTAERVARHRAKKGLVRLASLSEEPMLEQRARSLVKTAT
jgi:hypothetical protein